jgi:type I pantothenate kinase
LILSRVTTTPFLVGVAGAVAVGKTTIVRALAHRLEARGRSVRVVTTDAFLLPNQVLNERGLSLRKGFPESYDHAAIADALRRLRSGQAATVSVYSHDVYDIVAGATDTLLAADVVLVEGVVALQQPAVGYLNLAIYIDAAEAHVREWFVERFAQLTAAGASDASSFYNRLAGMPREQVRQLAEGTWETVNLQNLRDHIAPSAANADIMVMKNADHSVAATVLQTERHS